MTLSTSTPKALASYLGHAAAHAKLLLVPDPHSVALLGCTEPAFQQPGHPMNFQFWRGIEL